MSTARKTGRIEQANKDTRTAGEDEANSVGKLIEAQGSGQQAEDQYSNNNTPQVEERVGVGDAEGAEEDIQMNINAISRSGDLSSRNTMELKKDKRKGRPTGTKQSQIQTRSTSAKPTGSK